MILKLLLVLTALSSLTSGTQGKEPTSCIEAGLTQSGNATLYVNEIPVSVYCIRKGSRFQPYLNGEPNFVEGRNLIYYKITGRRSKDAPVENYIKYWTKVAVQLHSPITLIGTKEDYFTQVFNGSKPLTNYTDCQATFTIDLRSTPFKIPVKVLQRNNGYRILNNEQTIVFEWNNKCSIDVNSVPHTMWGEVVGLKSCAQRIVNTGDGESSLYVGPQLKQATIYCHQNKEYVTLPRGGMSAIRCMGENDTACGKTHWNKIRIDPQTLKVDNDDFTFADTTKGKVPFGVGGYCGGSTEEILDVLIVDLRGTSFTIKNSTIWNVDPNGKCRANWSKLGPYINGTCHDTPAQ